MKVASILSIISSIAGIITAIVIPLIAFLFKKYMESAKFLKARDAPLKQLKYNQLCKQKDYYKTISSENFITWQYKLLEKYYTLDYFTKVFDVYYPAFIFKGKNYQYPFNEFCKGGKNELIDKKHKLYKKYKKFENYKNTKYYKDFYEIMQPEYLSKKNYHKVKRPLMQGYMLDTLKFDDESSYVSHFSAWVGTFAQTVYTSHILEYENYVLYQKCKKNNWEINSDFEKIRRKLTLRNRIHRKKRFYDELKSGYNRASLIIIQLIVIIKDHSDHKYKLFLAERSDKVSDRSGFFQFVPTGGFEILGAEVDCSADDLKNNFSVIHAIFREFAEEIFDIKDFEKGRTGENVDKIMKHPIIEDVTKLIQEGGAFMEFLGSTISLVSLKNELSFVLRIDNEEYSKKNGDKIKYNFESKTLNKYTISEFNKFMEDKNKQKLFNPPSAALFSLLKENHLYKEINQ